uniref:Uncharacterized protein n=1 Tax=Arion vulgaris TaxID=1028688 RepID=A0A0B6ZQA4_9EUPU
MARQHSSPIGKKKIAQNTPRHVKSSSNTPTLQAGQPPTTTTDCVGCTTTFVFPWLYDGTAPAGGG